MTNNTSSEAPPTPEESREILKNLGCGWLAVWGWGGSMLMMYMGTDGAPSAYQAWACVLWTLLCVLVPIGLSVGLCAGLMDVEGEVEAGKNTAMIVIAAISAALSLVGIIAGLLLTPLAHHVAPKVIVFFSGALFALSVALMAYAGKNNVSTKGEKEHA